MPSPRSHGHEGRRSAAAAQPSNATQRFSAAIYRLGTNYCVNVPAEASRALGTGTHPPVAGEVAGVAFRTRLTPRGGGAYRLFLNGEVRAAAGAGLGDVVEVQLWPDEASRDPALPADLASALDAIPGGREAFEALTEAQREGMVAFLDRARTAETRERYVARVVEEVRRRVGW